MTTEMLKPAAKRVPFRPFRVRLPNAEMAIPTEENIHVHPDGKTVFIFDPAGGYNVVDISLITDLRFD